jgi:hypothetical protein
MNPQNNKENTRPIKAAIVSVLALLTALFGGFFLILNTILEKEMIAAVPSAQTLNISAPNVPYTMTAINTAMAPATQAPSRFTPNIPLTITAISVEEHPAFTLYWDHALWENAISKNVNIEDFEKDTADYGELKLPYLTGNGFLLAGGSTVQILHDSSLIDDGNHIHFRDWENGLTFIFPDGNLVSAFSFDYKASETWQLKFNDSIIIIAEGRKGFIGIVIKNDFPNEFNLYSLEHAQGGMTVDNITYISTNAP